MKFQQILVISLGIISSVNDLYSNYITGTNITVITFSLRP